MGRGVPPGTKLTTVAPTVLPANRWSLASPMQDLSGAQSLASPMQDFSEAESLAPTMQDFSEAADWWLAVLDWWLGEAAADGLHSRDQAGGHGAHSGREDQQFSVVCGNGCRRIAHRLPLLARVFGSLRGSPDRPEGLNTSPRVNSNGFFDQGPCTLCVRPGVWWRIRLSMKALSRAPGFSSSRTIIDVLLATECRLMCWW